MQEEKLIDDAALWKANRELLIEDIAEPEGLPEEVPGFIDVGDVSEEVPEEDITAKDVRNEMNALKLAQPSANLCVSIIDIIIPALVFHFAGVDKQLFKLDDDERATLTDAFANYLKEKDLNMSPGAVLLLAIAGVYVPKFMYIKMMRNERATA